MRTMLTAAALMLAANFAHAGCTCTCVDGEVKALCTNKLELPPLCAPRMCPTPPPQLKPLDQPQLPPLGTKACTNEQVLNPVTNKYEWRRVCK